MMLIRYQNQHEGRIYTGINVGNVDLSGLTPEEAENSIQQAYHYSQEAGIILIDPTTSQRWIKTPAELGLALDVAAIVENAFAIGREQGMITSIRDLIDSWYYGRTLAPIYIFDEGQLNTALTELSAEIYRPADNARLDLSSETAVYLPGKNGRQLAGCRKNTL